jgi:hypothetical protein
VVQAQGDKNTVLRIDARFVEDFRHSSHPSNGSVESAEYKDIHDHIESMELMNAQTVEAEKEKRERSAKPQSAPRTTETQASVTPASPSTGASPDVPTQGGAAPAPRTLEQHVQELRRQVQRVVKAPGAPLQSAPFRTATTLQSLRTGTEVLIVVSTPYWFGVETHEGQHGWILRDELEPAP